MRRLIPSHIIQQEILAMPTGTPGPDTILGTVFNELYLGLAGNDTLKSSAGFDILDGGEGTDVADYTSIGTVVTLKAFGILQKGVFTDRLISIEKVVGSSLLGDTVDHSGAVTGGGFTVTGTTTDLAAGFAVVNGGPLPLPLTIDIQNFENVIGSLYNDTITGNSSANVLSGAAGNDSLFGLDGNDSLSGGDGDDYLDGGFGFDTINGGNGNDTTSYAFYSGPIVANLTTGVVSFPGNSTLTDTLISIENLIATNGNDSVTGNSSANVLSGAAGNDTIIGGLGSDTLVGGSGNDIFRYFSTAESTSGALNRDTIADFLLGTDRLDLSAIDANLSIAGDQAFTFLGSSAAFTNVGQLRYQVAGGNLFLYGNVDANFATSEFELQLSGLASIAATNIIL
jgi:Ca2+-binding RTX toxin-like protein